VAINKTILESIEKEGRPGGLDASPDDGGDKLDQEYADEGKKYRNWLAKFDHGYELISHPFVLLVVSATVFIGIGVVFLVSRYKQLVEPDAAVFYQMHKDANAVFSFLWPVVITFVITKLLEKRKK